MYMTAREGVQLTSAADREDIEKLIREYQQPFYSEALIVVSAAILSLSIRAYGLWGSVGSIGTIVLAAMALLSARYIETNGS